VSSRGAGVVLRPGLSGGLVGSGVAHRAAEPGLIGYFPRSESGEIQGGSLATRKGLDEPKGLKMRTLEHFGGNVSREALKKTKTSRQSDKFFCRSA
jgi:hypothetical protein